MIRDPSDGSVKAPTNSLNSRPTAAQRDDNWGLKSLAKPERKPQPAPTPDELREHYARFNLGFKPKEEGQ